MENKTLFTAIISPAFAKLNFAWLQRFTFHNDSNHLYFFTCHSYNFLPSGFVEFEALLKSASEQVCVLLPLRSIDGILGGDFRKNQLGFLGQANDLE